MRYLKFKLIACTLAFLMLVVFTTKHEQAFAGESKSGYAKLTHRNLKLPPVSSPRAKNLSYVDYSHRSNRQNFELFDNKSDNHNKNSYFIKIAAIASYKELHSLYEQEKPRLNSRSSNGETALIKVLDGPYNEDTFLKVKFLIAKGASLHVRGKSSKSENSSPLAVAIWNSAAVFRSGNGAEVKIAQQILEVLIGAGADVSSLEANGKSVLHLAAETNNLHAAKLLLDAGAKVKSRDINYQTPLDIAESGEMKKLLKKYQEKGLS